MGGKNQTSHSDKKISELEKQIVEQLIPIKKKNEEIFDNSKEIKKKTLISFEGNLNDYIIKISKNKKLEIEEIKDIFIQFNNELLNNYLRDKNYFHGNIKMKNILYYKNNNYFKFYLIPKNEIKKENENENELKPPEKLKEKTNHSNKIDIWNLGLILYQLYEGKDFDYKNDYELLKNKIKNDIDEKYYNIDKSKEKEELNSEEKIIQNLIKKCLIIEDDKRIDFNDYFSHPFFNHIYIGSIKDKKMINNQDGNQECFEEYLNINLINLPKIFMKKLKLYCYEDNDIIFKTLNIFQNEFEEKINNEDYKDKVNEIIIYRVLKLDDEKIKEFLKFLNSKRDEIYDLIMPFIIFLFNNNEEIERKINDIIEKEELEKLDKRFIFFCKNSNNDEIIKNLIYRAFSYYNECGDKFDLKGNDIDLRKNKYEFYINIICVARTQNGKSTFINKFISSFGNKDEVRAKEGGNERSCSSKFASYYIDEIPIKMIDIIGYDGSEDNFNKLNDIINKMSIIIFQDEIHIILYLIDYSSKVLFKPKELDIFETLKLNVIKPKILFIRTKCQSNIYKESNNKIIVNLNALSIKEIKTKLDSMNTNFQNHRNDEKWKSILNYICYNENEKIDKNLKYFSFDNVCFLNLLNTEIITGEIRQIIKPFGMDYFKQQLNKLFDQILEEEKYRLNYWIKLGNESRKDDENILKIIRDMNFYNISKEYLSKKSSDYLTNLVTNKFENKILIEIKEIPPILIGLFTNDELIFFFMQIGIGVMKNKDNQFKLIINKSNFRTILEDFICYKVKCISSIESLIFKKK